MGLPSSTGLLSSPTVSHTSVSWLVLLLLPERQPFPKSLQNVKIYLKRHVPLATPLSDLQDKDSPSFTQFSSVFAPVAGTPRKC